MGEGNQVPTKRETVPTTSTSSTTTTSTTTNSISNTFFCDTYKDIYV